MQRFLIRRLLGWHGPEERPENIWSLAFRACHPPITPAQFDRYRALAARYGEFPVRGRRRLRYRIFDWIDGRRLCAPLLEREHCESRLINSDFSVGLSPSPAGR